MSYFLPHLPSGWHVDEAIKSEEDRIVVIRFGHDWDSQCMTMDETLYAVAEKVQNFAVIYLCDITEVPDFNKVCLLMFIFALRVLIMFRRCTNCMTHARLCSSIGAENGISTSIFNSKISFPLSNKHIMIDLGTGNNNKMHVAKLLLAVRCTNPLPAQKLGHG